MKCGVEIVSSKDAADLKEQIQKVIYGIFGEGAITFSALKVNCWYAAPMHYCSIVWVNP